MSKLFRNLPSADSESRESLSHQLEFLGQMVNTEIAFFQQIAASQNGLSITESKAVSILMQEGPTTAGELGKKLGLTTGAMTNLIDRMEKAGLVKRGTDPSDRRKVIVEMRPEKLKQLGKPYQSVSRAFHKLVSTYSIQEIKFLIDFYKSSIEITRAEIEKLSRSS